MRNSVISLHRSLRRMALSAVFALLVQSGFGVAVNLYTSIPKHHSGANPSNYLTGSFHSVLWSIVHGTSSLVIHAVLGILLVLMSISIVVKAFSLRSTSITIWSVLGLLFIVGAGFNGASFLDYNKNVSSLVMALLTFGAIACYVIITYLLGTPDWRHHYDKG